MLYIKTYSSQGTFIEVVPFLSLQEGFAKEMIFPGLYQWDDASSVSICPLTFWKWQSHNWCKNIKCTEKEREGGKRVIHSPHWKRPLMQWKGMFSWLATNHNLGRITYCPFFCLMKVLLYFMDQCIVCPIRPQWNDSYWNYLPSSWFGRQY